MLMMRLAFLMFFIMLILLSIVQNDEEEIESKYTTQKYILISLVMLV